VQVLKRLKRARHVVMDEGKGGADPVETVETVVPGRAIAP
jgi:hypothetical protein